MRIAVVAAAVSLSIVGLCAADDVRAVATRVQTHIPAQDLVSALKEFAETRAMQILYFGATVKDLSSQGAAGELTVDETLTQLLRGTGLMYRYINRNAVTIAAAGSDGTAPAQPLSGSTASAQQDSQDQKEGRDGSSDKFRVAQMDQGAGAKAAAVDSSKSSSQDTSTKPAVEEVVVTAQKRQERLKDVPISISVLGGKDLDQSTAQGVDEMLNRVPSVVVATPGIYGGTQVAIRGVAAGGAAADGSSPIGYYLDSVPFGFVRHAYAPDADVYDLQRVEVLRGPQGTLYGASAEAGVVRVLTNDADLSAFDLKARTTVSSTDAGGRNYRGDVAVNVPIIEDKLAMRAVVGYGNLSGWVDRTNESHVNDALLRTYRLKINAQPTDELSVGLVAWSTHDQYGAPSTADDAGRATGSIHQSIANDYDAYGIKVGYQFSRFSVTSMTSYLRYNNDFVLDLSPLQVPLPLNALEGSRVFSQEIIFTSTANSLWRWSSGVFFRDANDNISQNIGDIGATEIAFTDSSKSYALFGEVSRRFLDRKFEWTLGLRQFHDDVSSVKTVLTPPPSDVSQSFNATTPRAVLTWLPSDSLTVYGSYSQGFRSGMPQAYSTLQSDPNIPPLKPDKLHNFELGTKADVLDKRVSFDAAIFFIDWRDVQQTITVPYPGNPGASLTAQVNGATASGPGFEFTVTTRPLDGFDVGASFGWNDLTMDRNVYSGAYSGQAILFNKGDRLSNSSEYTAAGFASYTFPLGDLHGELSASANYASKQSYHGVAGNAVYTTNGDNLLFARASFSIHSPEHWAATVYADNVTNEHGAWPAVLPVADWYPRPRPRTIGMQLEYHYK